jgi:hypothetical protein
MGLLPKAPQHSHACESEAYPSFHGNNIQSLLLKPMGSRNSYLSAMDSDDQWIDQDGSTWTVHCRSIRMLRGRPFPPERIVGEGMDHEHAQSEIGKVNKHQNAQMGQHHGQPNPLAGFAKEGKWQK